MSTHLSDNHDDCLQRYIDGEASPQECHEVEKKLAASASYRAEHTRYLQLRDSMKRWGDNVQLPVDSEMLFQRILDDIDQQGVVPSTQKAPLIPFKKKQSKALLRWLSISVTTTALVAAAWMLWIQPRLNSVTSQSLALPSFATTEDPASVPLGGSAVIEADFGGNTGTVFAVEDKAGHSIAIVWINEQNIHTPR